MFNNNKYLIKINVLSSLNPKPRDSVREMFKDINILTLASQYIYENVVFVHKHYGTFHKKSDNSPIKY